LDNVEKLVAVEVFSPEFQQDIPLKILDKGSIVGNTISQHKFP
jgi:hypothetical protein